MDWTREQLLVALNVYQKLPFGQFSSTNPVLRDIAGRMGRTPSSLAMKLGNLASLDPAIIARGHKGLPGASRQDKAIWAESQADPAAFAIVTEDAFRRLFAVGEGDELDLVKGQGVFLRGLRVGPVFQPDISPASTVSPAPPRGSTEQTVTIVARRGQQFFRQMILNAFDSRCCVSGIGIRDLLVASHIRPGGQFPAERLSLNNGLCLSRLHDATFDRGLIAFDDELRMQLSPDLLRHLPQPSLEQNFVAYAGRRLTLPQNALGPSLDHLRHQRKPSFDGKHLRRLSLGLRRMPIEFAVATDCFAPASKIMISSGEIRPVKIYATRSFSVFPIHNLASQPLASLFATLQLNGTLLQRPVHFLLRRNPGLPCPDLENSADVCRLC